MRTSFTLLILVLSAAVADATPAVPPPVDPTDPTAVACKLAGTDQAACPSTAPACDKPSQLINLLSFAEQDSAAAKTCDSTKGPSGGNARACLDQELATTLKGTCQAAGAASSKYAAKAITDAQRDAIKAAVDAAMTKAATANKCSEPTTLCLDRNGSTIGAEKIVQKGDVLKVIVLTPIADDIGTISFVVGTVKSADSLTATPPPVNPEKAGDIPDLQVFVAASAVSDEVTDLTRAVRVNFKRGADQQSFEIPIEHGRYYVDFGLALPFVVEGTRTAVTPTLVQETTEPRATIAALVFPWGRPRDTIRTLGLSGMGVMIATDLNLTQDVRRKDYFFGGAYEPISGVGLSVGVAFVRGQFVAPVPGTADDTAYMMRFYFGVFLTPDFIKTARTAVDALAP